MKNESLAQPTDVIALAIRPDGKELAISTIDGNLVFWNLDLEFILF